MNISPGALFLKIKTLIYKLNPAPAVYGLEISDVALRLVDATRKEPRAVSLRLPPGIIEGGEIRDREVLRQALNEMRKGFSGSSSPLHVVLVVPSDHVFLQSFSIPALEEGREEAILLNVQSLSPRSLEEMRYGYEERGIEGESVGKLSIMAGFMEKRVIDVFHDTAQSALFMPVVIEFRSMALTRVLKERGLLKGSGEMFVHIEADGILLAALGTGLPLFERFIRWSEVGDEKNASRALSDEMRRFKNFYEQKERKRLEKIYVFGTGSVSEIADAIAAEEAEGKVVIIDQAAFPVPMSLLSAYGAALRGTIPPMRDSGFTLASRSAKDDYLRDLTRNFVRLWRVMSLVTISLLVVLFGIGDLYMVKSVRGLEEKAATLLSEPLANEAALLEEKAAEFNSFVDVLESAKKLTPEWSPLLGVVQSIARIHRISLDRIFINNESQLLLVGKAPEERAIVSFKDALALRPELKDVALPLTDIKSLPDGSFSFLLNGGIVKPET